MPYVGKKPADIIATSVDTDTGAFSGNVTAGGTLGVTGETTLATHLNLGDNDIIKVGAGSDIQIYHDGSYSRIMESGGTALVLDTTSTDIRLTASNSEVMGKFVKDGAVELYHNGSKKIETTSSGATITGAITATSGNVTITDGNLVVASGHGIDFSATGDGSGSMSGELFSDYEEGSFTPTYTGSGGNPTVTYDALQFGFYTRIGRKVFCIVRLRTDAMSGGGGVLQVSGLPYVADNSLNTNNYTSGGGVVSNDFGSNNPHSTMVLPNTSVFYLVYGNYGVNNVSDLQDGNNKNQIQCSFFYIAA